MTQLHIDDMELSYQGQVLSQYGLVPLGLSVKCAFVCHEAVAQQQAPGNCRKLHALLQKHLLPEQWQSDSMETLRHKLIYHGASLGPIGKA